MTDINEMLKASYRIAGGHRILNHEPTPFDTTACPGCAENAQLRAQLADATHYCSGDWPCEASTHAAALDRECNDLRMQLDQAMALATETLDELVRASGVTVHVVHYKKRLWNLADLPDEKEKP